MNLAKNKLCPNCLADNTQQEEFCKHCGCPIGDFAGFDPMKRIQMQGFIFRQAVSAPSSPLILIGMWLIFGPSLLTALAILITNGRSAFSITMPVIVISSIILFKATNNYVKNKKKMPNEAGTNNNKQEKT
jgi:hypothetical protein